MKAAVTSDTINQITGYTIVQGKSHDAIMNMFERHPDLRWKGASVDVIEFFAMSGM